MDCPDWCPQDVWDEAQEWSEAITGMEMTGAALPSTRPSIISRAILAAKAEERRECMADLLLLVHRHGEPGAVAENPYVNLNKAVAAIRKRGEV